MAMVCPKCSRSFDQYLDCPSCNVRLVYEGGWRDGQDGPWQQTPWGRILVGVLLAQGLAHGLKQFLSAWFMVRAQATTGTDFLGAVTLQGIFGLSLLFGGMVAGAGKTRGILYGSFVGLVNGLIFLFVQLSHGVVLNEIGLYSQGLMHVSFGALGGLVGRLVWRPLAAMRVPEFPSDAPIKKRPAPRKPLSILSGPVSWLRMLLGTSLVVSGLLWAHRVLQFILEVSEGKLLITSQLQAQVIDWEMSAIVVLIGAGVSGATTNNGLKQGLFTGVFATVILIGIHLGDPHVSLEAMGYLATSVILLSLGGGWFGGQLFPPVLPRRQRIPIMS
jgi:hypothetical protein